MSLLKKITRIILDIILTVALAIYILINIFSSTILKESYILNKLDEVNYYDKIYEDAKSNFENYIYQSGLDEKVLENILTKEKVEKDTKIIISNIYDGTNEKIETDSIKQNLTTNINQELGESISQTQQKAIDTFLEKIAEEYETTIVHTSYETKIHNIYVKALTYIKMANKVLLIAMGGSIVLLIILNIKRIYRAVSYVRNFFSIIWYFIYDSKYIYKFKSESEKYCYNK